MTAASRRAGRRQDGRGAAVRHAAQRDARRRRGRHRPAAGAGRRLARARTACRSSSTAEAAEDGRHPDPHRQAAGHGRAARRARAAPARPTGSSSRPRPASPTVVHRGAGCPPARRWSGSCPTRPVLVDEAMSAISAGAHAGRGAPGAHRGDLLAGRPDDPGAGVAAGRGDRAVRQRPGVLLLPGRGDDRRRHPARPAAPGRARPHRADRDRLGGDAARLRRAPGDAARGGDLAGRHHHQRDPRDGEPRRAGGHAVGPRGRPRSRSRARLRRREDKP